MEIDRKELKQHARQTMRLTKPSFWAVTLVFLLMTSGVSLVLGAIPFPTNKSGFSSMGMFASILFALYSAVVSFGYKLWCLWTHRQLDPGMGSLTQGFSVAGRVILMEANIYLRIILWSMAASFAVSFLLLPVGGPFALLFSILAVAVCMVAAYLRYALSPYLLADNPDAGPGPAIRHSVELMRGWKTQLFKLHLSFIGWDLINFALTALVIFFFMAQSNLLDMNYLNSLNEMQYAYQTLRASSMASLCSVVVTLPLTLWLMPYRGVTEAAFYDARLQAQRESAPTL